MQTNAAQLKTHFRIIEFTNRGGSKSWRVTGIGRDRKRIRQNFTSAESAQARHLELEADYLGRRGPEVLKTTSLTDHQLQLAEAAFLRLGQDNELLSAIEHWISGGKPKQVNNEKRLDEAVDDFSTWLESTHFREKTRINLESRINIFKSIMGDVRLSSITPEIIDSFLAKRQTAAKGKLSAVTLDNDRRAVSRFFKFCCERPRHWMSHNPCREVQIQQPDPSEPEVLTVKQCKRLLKAAQGHKEGKLLGYVVLGLFGGLRPFEAARLNWNRISEADKEIVIDASISKVKRRRVIPMNATLCAWLSLCRDKAFAPGDWDNELRQIRKVAKIQHWPADVLRHTALSHYFRLTKSFGETAEWGGTSEAIIRDHYKARVSSAECNRYWRMRP